MKERENERIRFWREELPRQVIKHCCALFFGSHAWNVIIRFYRAQCKTILSGAFLGFPTFWLLFKTHKRCILKDRAGAA